MVILVTIIHVIVCLFLGVVVLLQSGKAADLAGAFGGSGSQTVFGARGSATVLSKATTIAAGLFMLTSLTLSVLSTRTGVASPSLFNKTVPVTNGAAPAQSATPGGTVPIGVSTGVVGGKQGDTKIVNIPVPQGNQNNNDQKKAEPQK